MIKISVLYPHYKGNSFDINYYCNNHIPMVQGRLGASVNRVAVEQGLLGAELGSQPTYTTMGHLYFESVDEYQAAFDPHKKAITKDVPNYTDIEPTIQISEVKL
jgi:uncharacterized protein (TIGR02118 family)